MTIAALQQLQDDMKKCFRCSLCKMIPLPVIRDPRYADGCPASRLYHVHGYSGSGKSIMALSLLDGRIAADEALARVAFACTACGLCDVACKFLMDAERHLINMALREHLAESGFGLPAHGEAIENLRRLRQERPPSFSLSAWARSAGLGVWPEQKCRTLLLVGRDARDQAAAAATAAKLARLLAGAGIEVGVLGDAEPDTGRAAYWSGHRALFQTLARDFTRLLDDTPASTVVVLSGCDFGMLRAKYPEVGSRPRARVLHAAQILDQLAKRGRLKPLRPLNRRVTYHDPCYLGRQSEPPVPWQGRHGTTHGCMTYTAPPRPVNRGVNGVFEEPRNLLRRIRGLTLAEMHRVREYAFCCGGGGGVPRAYPELARSTALHRIDEARDTGAEVLVTACSLCRETLAGAQASEPAGRRLPVVDLVDLLFEAAGLEL